MNGPRGNAGPADIASLGLDAKRSETGDCAGGEGPAQVAFRARSAPPADGLKVTAEANTEFGRLAAGDRAFYLRRAGSRHQ